MILELPSLGAKSQRCFKQVFVYPSDGKGQLVSLISTPSETKPLFEFSAIGPKRIRTIDSSLSVLRLFISL